MRILNLLSTFLLFTAGVVSAQVPGDGCSPRDLPIVVLENLPVLTGTTCGSTSALAAYDGTCSNRGVPYPGPDVVYPIHLNPGNTGVGFTLDLNGSAGDLALVLVRDCGAGTRCVINSVDLIGAGEGPEVIPNRAYEPGLYHLVVDSADNTCGTYKLTVSGHNPSLDLEVRQRTVPDEAVAGEPLTYVLTVVNHGPLTAHDVVLEGTLPEGTRFVPGQSSDGCSADPGAPRRVTCRMGNMEGSPFLPRKRQITVMVDSAVRPGRLESTFDVRSNEGDRNLPNTRRAEVVVDREVTLELDVSRPPSPVIAGQDDPGNLVFTTAVRNAGPSDASRVRVRPEVVLPAGVEIAFQPALDAAGTWSLATLPRGDSAVLTAVLSVGPAAPDGDEVAFRLAAVDSAEGPRLRPAPAALERRVAVERRVTLVATGAVSASEVVAGKDELTYDLTLENRGPSNASGVVFTQEVELPAGVVFDQGTLRWTVPELGDGVTAATKIRFEVGASAPHASNIRFGRSELVANERFRESPVLPAEANVAVRREVDLRLTVEGPPEVIAGQTPQPNVVYEVTVENRGPSTASELELKQEFTLPRNVDAVEGDVVTWSPGELSRGDMQTRTFELQAQAGAAAGEEIVGVSMVEQVSGVNTGTERVERSTVVRRRVTLALEVAGPADPVVAGRDDLVFHVTVSNEGPSNASGLELLGNVPEGTTLLPGEAVPSGDGWSWLLPVLRADAEAELELRLRVGAGVIPGDDVLLLEVSEVERDDEPNVGESEDQGAASVRGVADLALTKVGGPPGGPYRLEVTSGGPSNVFGARVLDVLPAEVGGGFFDHAFDLSAGETAVFEVGAVPAEGFVGRVGNTALVTVPALVTDPELEDNLATVVTLVGGTNLEVTKDDGRETAEPGEALVYKLRARNRGPRDADGARLVDLPPELEDAAWTCEATSEEVSCPELPEAGGDLDVTFDLPAGEALVFELGGTVAAGFEGMLENTATLEPPPELGDPDLANNTATDTTIVGGVNLHLALSDGRDVVSPGEVLGFALGIESLGPENAFGVPVTTSFDPPVEGVTWSCVPAGEAACPEDSGVGPIDHAADLPAGSRLDYEVLVPTADVEGALTVTAGAGDESAADTTRVSRIRVAIDDYREQVAAGETLTYLLLVDNPGTDDAVGVPVEAVFDPMPEVSWTCAASGDASCPPAGDGPIDHAVDLPALERLVYKITVPIDGLTGVLRVTARADGAEAVDETLVTAAEEVP